MSRALILFALITLSLGGCSLPEQAPSPAATEIAPTQYTELHSWLQLQAEVADMPPEDVIAALTPLEQPDKPQELFYFSLLNQQLDTYESWVRARDALRELQQDNSLSWEQRQLAGILERYNQSRINWYQQNRSLLQKYTAIQTEVMEAEQENQLLRDKIQAITELETSISTRKE